MSSIDVGREGDSILESLGESRKPLISDGTF